MKAALIRRHGGPEVLTIEDVPTPRAGPGEVLVQVRACAINHLDVWVRRGIDGAGFTLPAVGGGDVSGTIAALGDGVDPSPGVRVGAPVMVIPTLSCGVCERCMSGSDPLCRQFGVIGETRWGGLAEFIRLPRANVVPKPDNLSFEEAAAVSLTSLTAWHMLVARAQLRFGETVLIQAAGSGVSCAAIQIAKHLGATVLTTASHPKKLEAAKALGADHAINYKEQDFGQEVRRIVGKRGVDVVVEHVGGETFERSARCLGWGGRLVTCGATTGAKATINLQHLFFKGQSLLGSTMGSKAEYHALVRLWAAGRLRAVIDRVLPLDDVADAHRALEAREVFGKVVLRP